MSGKMYRNCMIRIISVFSILLFFNASISIASAAQSLEGQRITQEQDLAKLKQKFQKAARKCCGLPDGTVDTTSNEYQRLLKRYNNTTSSTKLKNVAKDTRASRWETEARRFNLTKTGSNPKDVRADGDFVGDTHNVSRYRDHLREMGHDVVDYGYKIVDNTKDATVWRNEEQADLNAREVDPDVLQDMYEETGLDPHTHSPQDVIKEAKFIDDDAFSTSGGRASTGVKGETSDALGKVLDNEMKFRHALETSDMKTMGKSVDKMAFPELKNADPKFYNQAEILRNYGDPIKAGIVDLGDSEAVARQKIKNWQTKAEAHIQENLALARQHSQTTRMVRERIAERVAATDPEMAERIRTRNDRVLETNTRVENMNRATKDRMAREGKEPSSTEVDKYRNELQAKVRENVKGQNIVKENGIGRKIETKMREGTEGGNIRHLDLGATANRILHGIGLIMVAHDAAGRIGRAYKATDEYKPQVAIEEGVSFTSGMAGASALGAEWGWAGGLIGSAICPGIGTAIGSFTGGLVGGIIGYTKGDSWGRQQGEWISSKLGVNQNVGNKQITSAADKLYNSLLRKGVPKDKAMEATKLLLSGHLEQFQKYMAALRDKYVSSLADVMGKEKMSGSERANFINCMCRNSKSSGMLGNHIDPDGGCVSCGPLNCWPVPIGTAKTTVLNCVNQLARARYRRDKAVFEEMHSLDEKTYRQKLKLIEEENAGRVAKKRQKLERLRKDKKTLVEAGKLFLQIKDWLKTDDKNRLEMGLSSRLWSWAYENSYNGRMDDAVASLEMMHKVRGETTENDKEFETFTRWQKNWKEALSKTFPKIRQQISSGDLLSAESMIHKLGGDMLDGNRLPEADTSPEVLDIKKRYQKKTREYNQAYNQIMEKIRNLESERDPRGAVSLLKEFLHEWQIENSQKNYLSEKLAHNEALVRMADESARAGDMYTANANYPNAIKSYQDSLYNQRDSSVQSKLDRALSEIADAKKSLAQEELEEKAQKLLEEGRKNWQEGNLQQAIAKVAQAQKLAGEDKEIAKTLTAMTKQKKEIDTKLDQVADLLGKGKLKSGESVLTAAAVISTNYPPYKELLQRLNAAKKRAGETKKQNQRAEQLRNKAKTSWQNGELDKAVEHMQKASQAAPDNAEIAKALKAMQHQKKAIDEALAISDQLIRQGKFKEAKSALKKAEFINTKYPRCTKTAAKLALSEKRAAAEKALAQEKLRQKEEQKKARVRQLITDARRLEESRDLKAAAEKYRQVQQLEPTAETAARISKIEQQLNPQPASKQNVSDTLSKPPNQSTSGNNQFKGTITSQTSSPNSKEKAKKKPSRKNSTGNKSAGYWQLVEEKGSIGRECSPKEVYNDYYRDTVSGFGSHVVITKMIREGNQVYCKLEGQWQRPPEKLYPGRTINLPVTINRLADTGKYWCDMAIYFDMHDMECGSSGAGGDIGGVKLDRKGPKTISKEITWKVKEPFYKKAGEKLTIRACYYAGASICGKNKGMKYYYQWIPDGSAAKTSIVAKENAAVGRKTTKVSGRPLDTKMVAGKTITSTSYTPNNKGDVFKGGHWAGASGGSDWLEKDFTTPQMVTGVYIGEASTDITTNGFKLVLKLKKPDGKWATIDELHNTNINRTALSGGAVGKSIPPYTKKMSQAIKATAFRLEFYGHGWFDATDIRIYTSDSYQDVSQTGITSVGKGSPRDLGEPSTVGKGTIRSSDGSVNARNSRESLTINKKVYEPNEQIRLNFTSAPEQNAWIGMYDSKVKHIYDAPNITYQNSDAKASGERVFGAPNSEGEYQFRLFGRKNRKELVVLPFTVKVDKNAASLTINKKIYEPNEKIQLNFKATTLQNAWIGMYDSKAKHAYDTPNITYQNSDAKTRGERVFGAPNKEGAYEFRLYERTNHKELAVLPFTVKVDKDAASLTINKKIYEPNEKIQLKFTATPLQNGWVGMYSSATKHSYDAPNITWKNFNSKPSGNIEFGAPQKEGIYEFRLHERTNHKELVVLPFTVKVDKDAASLIINKNIYEPNERIQLHFTATPLQNAWIGMYKSETEHAYSASNITWQNCESKTRGVREFTAPTKRGSYEFRLYERTNHKELVVLPFVVTDN